MVGCLAILFPLVGIISLFVGLSSGDGELIGIGLILTLISGFAVWNGIKNGQKELEDKNKLHKKIQNKFQQTNLEISQKFISINSNSAIGVDENNKKVSIVESNGDTKKINANQVEYTEQIFLFKDILESEVLIDGETVTKTSRSSQLGGALIGAVVAGGVGAIIGGLSGNTSSKEKVEKIQLKIIVNDTRKPIRMISFLEEPISVDKKDDKFKRANDEVMHWHSLFKVLIEIADSEDKKINETSHIIDEKNNGNTNVADEIRKLYALLKEGILTQEEFDTQKKKIIS